MKIAKNPGNAFNADLINDLTGWLQCSDRTLTGAGLNRATLQAQLATLESELAADIARERRFWLAEQTAEN